MNLIDILMKIAIHIFGFLLMFLISACVETGQNTDAEGQNILEMHATDMEIPQPVFCDTVYVPIYSEIYSQTKDTKFLLTATLSIRNTSMTNPIFLSTIDYYNSAGELVRKYLDKNISLKPLETIDYVIEEDDISGGTGANFIIIWSARKMDLKPVFQGVMISTNGQQGISYITNGVSIKQNKN